MENNFYIVIMAGGSGTRLWPVSRCNLPKQLHNLCSDKSLIQETYGRIKDLVPRENIYVSLVENILKTSQKQLQGIPKSNFIVEPECKNTAPATALLTATIFQKNPNAIIATIASDHTVNKVTNYQKAILQAADFVKRNSEYLVTIGIHPTRPDTGFGYIKMGEKFKNEPAMVVEKFVEKPDLKTAKKYLQSDKYLWNGCYFIFSAATMIKLFEKYEPKIYEGIKSILKGKSVNKIYATFPKLPIETTIIEKTQQIAVIPADLGWSDVGSWASLYELLSKKGDGEVVSLGHHVGINDKNCLVYASDRLLATVGLEDIIIVDTPDVTLICNKNKSQDVKLLIEKLKKEGKDRYL